MRGKSLKINEKKSEKNGKMSDDNKRMEKNKSGMGNKAWGGRGVFTWSGRAFL